MTAQDDKFGRKIKGFLDHGTASLKPGTAYRLQLARQNALARLEPRQVAQPALALAGAGGPNQSLRSSPGLWASARLWIGIAVIAAAAFGYFSYQQWRVHEQVKELEETDTAILTSDLPIDAYLDRGFQNWLRHSEN